MTLCVKMEELALHQILACGRIDILEDNVKLVCFRDCFAPSICLHYTLLAICDPVCENGGTCTAPDICKCFDGYSGEQCEIGMF